MGQSGQIQFQDEKLTPTRLLYYLLYVVLYTFIKRNYNSIVRQLIKLMLTALQPAITQTCKLPATTGVGYLLAIFEAHIAEGKISRDSFDLLALWPFLFEEHQLKQMNLYDSLQEVNSLQLMRLSPPHVKSRHVIICISGWRQEDEPPMDFWGTFVGYWRHAEVFYLRWTSGTAAAFYIKDHFKQGEKRDLGNLLDIYNTSRLHFFKSVNQGQLTGTMLAHYLAKSDFGKNRAVSLTGFSLGGLVTFNCMKMLKRISDHLDPSASSILHDVTLWAAAYTVELTGEYEEKREKAEACTVCNGRFNNCFSVGDHAMTAFMKVMYPGKTPVGYYAIFAKGTETEIREEDVPNCKIPENYDLSEICPGHGIYAEKCGVFLYDVKDAY